MVAVFVLSNEQMERILEERVDELSSTKVKQVNT